MRLIPNAASQLSRLGRRFLIQRYLGIAVKRNGTSGISKDRRVRWEAARNYGVGSYDTVLSENQFSPACKDSGSTPDATPLADPNLSP